MRSQYHLGQVSPGDKLEAHLADVAEAGGVATELDVIIAADGDSAGAVT